MNKPRQKHTTYGFSLLELMLAIAISSLLVIGVVTIYGSTKHTYQVNQVNARLQENIRFAGNNVATEIRQAGFSGCGNYRVYNSANIFEAKTITVNPGSTWKTITDLPLQGIEGTGTSAGFPDEIKATVDTSSDALIIYRASNDDRVKYSLRVSDSTFQVNTNAHGIQTGDILLLTNCERTAMIQVTKAESGTNSNIEHDTTTGTPGNCTMGMFTTVPCSLTPPTAGDPDNWNADSNTTVRKWLPFLYYIAPSNNNPGIKSLYRLGRVGPADELVEGVESMQITYGVDSDADGVANYYAKANTVTDFNEVVSIKIGMLFATVQSSKKTAPTTAKTYNLAGTSITAPKDRKSRQALNMTIKLRNLGATL